MAPELEDKVTAEVALPGPVARRPQGATGMAPMGSGGGGGRAVAADWENWKGEQLFGAL